MKHLCTTFAGMLVLLCVSFSPGMSQSGVTTDTTNQGLSAVYTTPTSNADTWHCQTTGRYARVQ